MVLSTKSSATTADVDLAWYPVSDTGGVPLTGYNLYQIDLSTSTLTLAYSGASAPSTLAASLTGLTLDIDYEFYLTALNPDEGLPSTSL